MVSCLGVFGACSSPTDVDAGHLSVSASVETSAGVPENIVVTFAVANVSTKPIVVDALSQCAIHFSLYADASHSEPAAWTYPGMVCMLPIRKLAIAAGDTARFVAPYPTGNSWTDEVGS